jgi:hypothetical protein
MVRRLLSLTAKDLRLITRSHFLTVVLGLAVLYALVVHFLLPADITTKPGVVLWDTTQAGAFERMYLAAGGERVIVVASEAAFLEAMETANRIGIKVIPQADNAALPGRIEVTYQGHEGPKVRRLLEATLRAQAAGVMAGGFEGHPVYTTMTLRDAGTGAAPAPPLNMATLPVLVLSEAAMIGLLLAAALLFSEKEEGTLRAYRVTPGGLLEYILAKALAMAVLGLAFTVLLTILTVGVGVNWLALLTTVFLGAVLMTMIALLAASAFQNLNQFMFTAVVMNILFAIPALAYFMPSFSPALLQALPTYPLVFALREAFFPAVGAEVVSGALAQMALTLVVVLPLTFFALRWQLARRDA